ncbi:MAG: hypothetical protein H3C31_05720 [Brumimicrobium sp.]|nr:hypothetical protein [Brumimicrobium sp.]MCO5267397.1 hypothetical protein [Brumimicrobium sp.]
MRYIVLSLWLFSTLVSNAQLKSKWSTNGKGALFGQFSYNSSVYSRSDVELHNTNYTITLKNVQIRDNIEGKGIASFISTSSPQFGAKLGYYIANKWAIIVSYDRYNTFFVDNQSIQLDGTFAPESNETYTGTYTNLPIILRRNDFNIQQRQGMNYFALGVQRADEWIKSRTGAFSFQTVYGLKIGGIQTKIDYTFNGITKQSISSFGGLGIAANIGLRFDFWQHVFLQLGLDGGYLSQNKIKTGNNAESFAIQKLGFLSPNISLGFSLFTSSNGCDTCPKW